MLRGLCRRVSRHEWVHEAWGVIPLSFLLLRSCVLPEPRERVAPSIYAFALDVTHGGGGGSARRVPDSPEGARATFPP
ncbi:hypothetical protein EV122DRAFT_285705 [Schizophyllum commune]